MTDTILPGPHDLSARARKRLAANWHTMLLDPTAWPLKMSLGSPKSAAAAADFASLYRTVRDLHQAAHAWGATLIDKPRDIAGSTQRVPTHLIVPTIDVYAAIAGDPWPATINDARQHLTELGLDPADPTTPRILRTVRGWEAVDLQLLRTVAAYFHARGPATRLTARQIPVDGVHAKWIEQHKAAVKLLSGLDDLGLVERPSTVNFTYLDPDHRAAGQRHHDSYTLSDAHQLAYQPDLVIICENDDTALYYPPIPRAISLRGSGHAATRLAHIPWLNDVPLLVYWGDIDHHGYEILDNLRHVLDRPVPSICMDLDTYQQHERYGTRTDRHGRPINPAPRQQVRHLTPDETAVYQLLTSPGHTGPLRIEQERIAYPSECALLRAETDAP